MNKYKYKIVKTIKDNRGIFLFFVSMFGANIIWKLCFYGNEYDDNVLFLNKYNMYGIFHYMAIHITKVSYLIIHFFDSSINIVSDTILKYDNGKSTRIVWGCTGIKQMFIFTAIMLCSTGLWKNKLWFIPLGLVACYLINIFRITFITMIIKNHVELFSLYHDYIFKYLYYTLIFIIWILWEHRYKNISFKKHKNEI